MEAEEMKVVNTNKNNMWTNKSKDKTLARTTEQLLSPTYSTVQVKQLRGVWTEYIFLYQPTEQWFTLSPRHKAF